MEDQMIQTVIFDMGGVIFKNGTKEAIEVLISKYKVDEVIAKDIYTSPKSWDLRAGLLTSNEYWSIVEQKYGDREFFKQLNLKELWYDQFTPLPGMLELLHGLKGQVRLGIISGNIVDRVEYLFNKYEIRSLFEFEGYSFNYNLHKNDPRLYQKVIEEFGVNAPQTLFIDDQLDCLEAAEKSQLKTHHFKNSQQLKLELERYGLSTTNYQRV